MSRGRREDVLGSAWHAGPGPLPPSLGAEILLFLIIDAEGCGVPHLISAAQRTPGM